MSWEVIIYKQHDTYGKDTFNVLDLYECYKDGGSFI